jgi:flagellar basal-body rod protein FlgB
MTGFFDSQLGVHARALQLRSQRLDVLAGNIANADTPGYKARDLDVGKALAGPDFAGALEAALGYRQPLQASLDGNTVELAVEQTAFAETMTGYRASLSFLTGRIQSLMKAMQAGE